MTDPNARDWTDKAACLARVRPCHSWNHPGDPGCEQVKSLHELDALFFGNGGNVARAKRICKTCPVIRECLIYAARSQDSWRHGVYGGLSADERHWVGSKPDLPAALAAAHLSPEITPEEELDVVVAPILTVLSEIDAQLEKEETG